ncbi:MAG: glycosyltransferase family 39 protein [Robiginitomaculum sp.]|nr:glycosyltransferase family 39 protein [Robiginitomaculum sp.]
MSTSSINYHRWVLVLLLVVSVFRMVGLYFSPVNLHGDEAQYWAWSRTFEWGYFSKPPMIAWVIGATTSVFGNAEWAVRLSSVILHPLIAYVLFRTARFMYGNDMGGRTGFWAAALYFLMPAVWLSSGIVSTDVPLLLCWVLGLNAWAHLRETPTLKWALLLGLAIGFGMLSKYAMLFFLPALLLCTIFDAKTRRALLSVRGLVVAALALGILAPNIWWNIQNDFATITHTVANASLKGIPFHPLELLEFWGSQTGIFGPLLLVLLVMALVAVLKGKLERKTVMLALFVLSPLAVISLEALLSRANANWAVTAYMAGSILVARYGLAHWPRFCKAGVWVNITMGVILAFATIIPAFANMVGQANAFKRVRGWPETESIIARAANAGHEGRNFTAIATDNRLVFYDLLYYGIEKDTGLPLRMWRNTSYINHHAEATASLAASTVADGPILIVNYYRDCEDGPAAEFTNCIARVHAHGKLTFAEKLREDFIRLEKLPPLTLDLGGGKTRKLNLWAGYGYTPTDKSER